MLAFDYPARFRTGSDGRVLVEFIDLPRVATEHATRAERIQAALAALGKQMTVEVRDAA